MAFVKKIVTGFVVQTFDTDTNKFISQEFVAGDQTDYENEMGDNINGEEEMGEIEEHYFSLDMVQPED